MTTNISNEKLKDIAESKIGTVGQISIVARDIASELLQRREAAAAKPIVTDEHRRVIRMLLKVCGAAFELADDSCQQEVDGEACHVVPDSAFQKLSEALDEIENTLPSEYNDLPNTILTWAAVPRHALRSLLQLSGNSEQLPAASGPEKCPGVPAWVFADNVDPRRCYAAGWKAHAVASGNSPVIPDGSSDHIPDVTKMPNGLMRCDVDVVNMQLEARRKRNRESNQRSRASRRGSAATQSEGGDA